MRMRNLLLGVMALLVSGPLLAADIDGKWDATVDSPMGAVKLMLEFKADGQKLTGSIASDMGGQAMPPSAISEGTIKGEDVAFKLSVSMAGQPPLLITYVGKLKGDELDLTSTMDMGQGPQETKLVAKRAKG